MLKLMLLEDQTMDQDAVERIVKSFPDVEWIGAYADPQEALDEAILNQPDIVIASVELTDMNGLTFTSKLQEVLPSIRVIVSAHSGDYARQAYEVGARGYLIKPVGKESLMKVLGQVRESQK